MASSSSFVAEAMLGVINSVLLVPICISFAAIIYRDPFFEVHLPMLIKMVMFSCLVHQAIFTSKSTLPFAVGQVQDAGLIFLSAMATSVVAACHNLGVSDQAIISTVLVTLSLATFTLGLALMALGRGGLATIVQFLPMPVVGGYLAFIGFFCGQAGLALMAQVQIVSLSDWYKLGDERALMLITPGIILAITLYTLVRNVRHMMTMPLFLVATLVAFYMILYFTSTSLQDARDAGWVAALTEIGSCTEGWSYLDFSQVQWQVLPSQLLSWAAMVLVVAFSSCLDVAAIEMEVSKPLDYNKELETVGLSNAISGIMGGYTGSYIFSQTIFNLRAEVKTRVTGFVIVLVEILVFVLPFSPMAYVPKAFFGCLLLLISIDLCVEWLWGARNKMAAPEFAVNILTFIFCLVGGVEAGIALGFIASMVAFITGYAAVPAMTTSSLCRASTVVRTFEERMMLQRLSHKVMVLSMKGYIFFGSSVLLLRDAKRALRIKEVDKSAAFAFQPKSPNQLKGGGDSNNQPTSATKKKAGRFASPAACLTPISNRGGVIPAHYANAATNNNYPNNSNTSGGGGVAIGGSRTPGRVGGRVGSIPPLLQSSHSIGASGGGGVSPTKASTLDDSEMQFFARSFQRANSYQAVDNSSFDSIPQTLASEELEMGFAKSGFAKNDAPFGRMNEPCLVPLPPIDTSAAVGGGADKGGAVGKGQENEVEVAILDFSKVIGLDASAARSCFLMLKQTLRMNGILCVFVVESQDIEDLLIAHQVIVRNKKTQEMALKEMKAQEDFEKHYDSIDSDVEDEYDGFDDEEEEENEEEDEDIVFGTLDEALEWCEEKILYEVAMDIAATVEEEAQSESSNSSTTSSSSSIKSSASAQSKGKTSKQMKRDGSGNNLENFSIGFGVGSKGGLSRDPIYYRNMRAARRSMISELEINHQHGGLDKDFHRGRNDENTFVAIGEVLKKRLSFNSRDGSDPTTSVGASAGASVTAPDMNTNIESLLVILEDYLQVSPKLSPLRSKGAKQALLAYFERSSFQSGAELFQANKASDCLYFVETGTIDLIIPPENLPQNSSRSRSNSYTQLASSLYADSLGTNIPSSEISVSSFHLDSNKSKKTTSNTPINYRNGFNGRRLQRICGGGICGELGFFVGEPQKFKAISVGSSVAWKLSHANLMKMQHKDPQLAILVQTALLKSLALFDTQQHVLLSQTVESK